MRSSEGMPEDGETIGTEAEPNGELRIVTPGRPKYSHTKIA